MPHRTGLLTLCAAALAALLAGCASGGSTTAPPTAQESTSAANLEMPATEGPGIRAGWMNLKRAEKRGQLMNLALLSESSKEGKLIASGRASMDGGKVISDDDAGRLVEAFARAGFDRFAVKAPPTNGPQGALGVVWIDRGRGIESLFLIPGARQNDATKDLPDVYQGLKVLLLGIHQSTPGSSVKVEKGWSGEELLKQKPGDTVR